MSEEQINSLAEALTEIVQDYFSDPKHRKEFDDFFYAKHKRHYDWRIVNGRDK